MRLFPKNVSYFGHGDRLKIIIGTILLTAFWWVVFGGVLAETYYTLYQVGMGVFELVTSGEGRLS